MSMVLIYLIERKVRKREGATVVMEGEVGAVEGGVNEFTDTAIERIGSRCN
jgi:hypothetical protein